MPDPDLLRIGSWALLFAAVLLAVTMLATSEGGRTRFGPGLGADFAQFYVAATLVRTDRTDQLYDLEVQDRLHHALLPAVPASWHLPYAYPAWLAWLISPLSHLPYEAACGVWYGITACLAVIGVRRSAIFWQDAPPAWRRAAVPIALAFPALAFESWLGGQISVLALILVVEAIRADLEGHDAWAGLMLGLLSYKPTLLPWILVMLMARQRFRTLVWLIGTASTLSLISLALTGGRVWADRVVLLLNYSEARASGTGGFTLAKYVDLNAWLQMVLGPDSPAVLILLVVGLMAGGLLMLRSLDGDPRRAWSAALAATLALNLYVGIYDAILMIPMVATGLALRFDRQGPSLPHGLLLAIGAAYVAPVLGIATARALGVTVMLPILAVLATLLVRQTGPASDRDSIAPDALEVIGPHGHRR